MIKHVRGKSELVKFGEIDGKEFYAEFDDHFTYYWFGNHCVVPRKEGITRDELVWLVGIDNYERANKLMQEAK